MSRAENSTGRLGRSALRLTAALLFSACVFGQAAAQAGGILVRVTDAESRQPLPGATVALTNSLGLAPPAAMVTAADGIALFPVLPAGRGYRIEVSLPGYARTALADIRVEVKGDPVGIPISLLPERVERETVVAKRDVVDLASTSTSTRFDDSFLDELPVQGRFYQNALTLAPGVQDSDGDGNPNVHGARSRDFKATVDGVSNQDPLTGQWLSYVNPESIAEIEIVTAGAGAEFGRAQGGFARIIQKQGSNDFEGVAGFLYRTSKLDGNGASSLPEEQVPSFGWIQPSLLVSGPIAKDRLWFRLSFEYIDVDEPVSTGSGIIVSNRTQWINAHQITWQASPRTRLAFQVQTDPLVKTNVGVTSTIPIEAGSTLESGGPNYGLTWTAAYSPKLLVESQVAYQNHHFNIVPTTSGVSNDCVFGITALERAQCFSDVSGFTSGSAFLEWRDRRQRFTARSQATFYGGKFLGTRHEMKAGISVENERYFRDLTRTPDMTLFVPSRSVVPPRATAIVRFAVPGFSTAHATGTSWSLFAEDRIRPRANLTASLGVRLDVEQINSNGFLPFDPQAESEAFIEAFENDPNVFPVRLAQVTFTGFENLQGFLTGLADQLGFEPILSADAAQSSFWNSTRRPGNIEIDNRNVSPRLSISWDPWNDGKTKVAMTAGRYYDKIFLAVPLIELEPTTTSIRFDARRVEDEWRVTEPTTGVNPGLNVQVVDRDLRTPYKDEYTLSFEREVARETSLKLTYIRSDFRDQLQDMDINRLPGDFGRCQIPISSIQPPVLPSPGSGQFLIDPYTGESYQDSDPGGGDGRIDDCTGVTIVNDQVGDTPLEFIPRRDGFPDLYRQSPAWGSIFLVGNFNEAEYRAFVLEVVRRQYRGWQLEGSYTFSKAIGDAEDFDVSLGDDRTTLVDEHGYLAYDQRHVVKVNATAMTPWGFRLGLAASWQSGLPYSLLEQAFSFTDIPPPYSTLGTPDPTFRTRYPTHQRNDQRNAGYWNFDVRGVKEFNLPKGMNLQLTAEVFNLLDDGTLVIVENVAGTMDSTTRFGRRFQVGFRLSF